MPVLRTALVVCTLLTVATGCAVTTTTSEADLLRTAAEPVPAATVRQGPTLETVVIYTADMTTLADFYQRGLGLGPFDAPSPGRLGCSAGGVYFGFDEVSSTEGCSAKVTTLWFTVDDLDATFARLVDMGASVRFPPRDRSGGIRLAGLYDPDGNLVGLSQRR